MELEVRDLRPYRVSLLKYRGFHDVESHCGLGIFQQGDEVWVIFLQMFVGTSITNRIEHLASLVFEQKLKETRPEKVRWFEFYLPETDPMVVWQEVQFGVNGVRPVPRLNLIERGLMGLGLMKEPGRVDSVVFDEPRWRPVSDSLVLTLCWLIYVDPLVAAQMADPEKRWLRIAQQRYGLDGVS